LIKAFLLVVILLKMSMFASDDKYTLKLYEKVIPLVLSSKHINIYTDKKIKQLFKYSHLFTVVSECKKADIVIGSKFEYHKDIKCIKQKPLFATSYPSYIDNENSFGAFYWRKGRPQLRLNKKGIKRYNFMIPDSLERFAK